ncbi:GMP synthase [Marinilongibacter aquaticus]|uniref:type 1 glutamine amidotransferase n=1 Tax=Marinilongibacter aquaticus TaxID=2975157 RepID=UPI0021BD2941|nr:GMP synthase [Marinilongibacter aquaticus]UBM59263.1 GMP synthase [Marinilongibacter aquaticus]
MNRLIKLAIIDFYNGYPNEGMRCIKMLVDQFFENHQLEGHYDVIDVRDVPNFPKIEEYDLFISTGGPGNPIVRGEDWELNYAHFLKELLAYNEGHEIKKHALMICHSFQIMVQFFKLGLVCQRHSTSFGVMPVHMTEAGKNEVLFENLADPFYAVDSRDYQVIQPDEEQFKKIGAQILALEKIRPHVSFERAVMGIRINNEIVGFQFHPEADAEGMRRYFLQEDKRMAVIAEHGEEKLDDMLNQLEDEDKIKLTESVIIPKFLATATAQVLNLETA